eukprot:SAG11_NODE_949_length_6408_cov_16.986210_7_plen_239_part_00
MKALGQQGRGGDVAASAMQNYTSKMMNAVKSVAAESQGSGNGWDLLDQPGVRPEKPQKSAPEQFFDNPDDRVEEEGDDWEMEDDDDLEALRMRRLEEMKRRHKELQQMKNNGHGEYTEIVEDQFLKEVTSSKHVVCHFYHKDFESCKVFDDRFRILAKKFQRTKFIYIDAEKAPFFVTKLGVKILPCCVCFMNGVAVDRLIGTMELGNTTDFSAALLALRLAEKGMIEYDGDGDEGDL